MHRFASHRSPRAVRPATQLARVRPAAGDAFAAVSTPIYQTATFAQESALACGAYDYTRSGNPTRTALEDQLAQLEGAERVLTYGSGLAALAAVVRTVAQGGEVLAGSDLYGGTFRLLSTLLAGEGIGVTYVDAADIDAVAAAFTPRTRLLLIETPTNPRLRIFDLGALVRLSHAHGALLAVDNSLLTPLYQRPLALGADLVVYSATKALAGHSDVTAGAVAVADAGLGDELDFRRNAEGTALAPFEAWLLLRGLKTLALRLERQEENAQRVARFLSRRPLARRIHYPGFADHPGHGIQVAQATGFGSVVSFETGSVELSRRIAEATEIFTLSVSFGGVGSFVSLPCRMSHASIPAEVRSSRELPEDLVRLAVGIEDARDLEEDLERALALGSAVELESGREVAHRAR